MAVTLQTYGEQLADVQKAIQALTTGGAVEYEINGRRVRREGLEWLEKREKRLEDRVATFGADAITGSSTSRGAYRVEFS